MRTFFNEYSYLTEMVEFIKPSVVRNTFERDSAVRIKNIPQASLKAKPNKRIQRTNNWPASRLNYEAMERLKQVYARAKHPTGWYRAQNSEYRVCIMPWSRAAYLDIRLYKKGKPGPIGILLHYDVISALLPYINHAVQAMAKFDTREPDKKAVIEVLLDESAEA